MIAIGDRVRFAPNPRWPDRMIEAVVLRHRADSRIAGRRPPRKSEGWFDTRDDDAVVRSVRPSRCMPVDATDRPTGIAPADQPNPIAAADTAAVASLARPDGDLRPGRSTSLDRGA